MSARPLHTLLIGAAMLVAGEHPAAGQMVSASAGVATVALSFIIARHLFGLAAALVTAASLAMSGYHALYSTQALSESDSLFFAALALWLFLTRRVGRAVWTGLPLGLAFTANPRLWILVPLFMGLDLLRPPEPRVPLFIRWGLLVGAFLLPVAALVVTPQLAAWALGTPPLLGNYLGNQLGNIRDYASFASGRSDAFGVPLPLRPPLGDQLAFYPNLVWTWDGPLLAAITIAGIVAAAIRSRPAERLVLLLFAGIVGGETFLTPMEARYFVLAALPAALLAGRCVGWLMPAWRFAGATVLLGLLLLEGLPRATSLASVPSGYRGAAAFVVRQSGGRHLSNQPQNTGFYTGASNARWLSEDLAEVRSHVAEGYFLAVVALRPSLGDAVPWGRQPEVQRLMPIARLPNPYGAALQNVMEMQVVSLEQRLEAHRHTSSSDILIYDLRDLFPRGPGEAS